MGLLTVSQVAGSVEGQLLDSKWDQSALEDKGPSQAWCLKPALVCGPFIRERRPKAERTLM